MTKGEIVKEIERDMISLSDAGDASFLQRFFKTLPGQYGGGDHFRGIRVPALRSLVRKHTEVTHEAAIELLSSGYHEDRLLTLMMMVRLYQKGDEPRASRSSKPRTSVIRFRLPGSCSRTGKT